LSFGSSAKTAELHDRGSLIKGSSSLSFGRSATNADLHGECNSDKSIWSSGETAELHGGEGSLPSSSSVEGSGKLSRKERIYERSKAVLSNVALPDPDRILRNYPFQLSGGMRQRICIALAVSTARTMLIADEPTTSLDVTIQAQILDLIRKIVDEKRTSLVLITHSLGVAREMTDRVYVMYAGTMIEVARTERLYDNPLHPYTQGLLVSVPRLTGGGFANGIPGRIPDYLNPPAGCRFAPRCPKVFDACRERKPPFFEIAPDHKVACFLYDKRGSAHA
ncbi:MAG: ABC transporter ATP-binding protein, partial [Spirochaetes bacterium]|nr:ABC transporter ATP-binding protein [Spirochaetota bacterium]